MDDFDFDLQCEDVYTEDDKMFLDYINKGTIALSDNEDVVWQSNCSTA